MIWKQLFKFFKFLSFHQQNRDNSTFQRFIRSWLNQVMFNCGLPGPFKYHHSYLSLLSFPVGLRRHSGELNLCTITWHVGNCFFLYKRVYIAPQPLHVKYTYGCKELYTLPSLSPDMHMQLIKLYKQMKFQHIVRFISQPFKL